MKHKLRFGLIVAIPIIICIAAVSIRVAVPKAQTVTIEGDIEVDVRSYYVQATGAVTSLPIGVGQTVAKGALLIRLDDAQARSELSQLDSALLKAQAALHDLSEVDHAQLKQAQVNISKNNVTIARESLAASEEVLTRLQEEYALVQTLYDAELVAQTELDAIADSVSAQEKSVSIAAAQLDNAKEQLIIAGMDIQTDMTEKIAMAQADIDSIEAQIAFAQSQLAHYTVHALDDGVVISLSYDEGGLAFSGTQVCEVSRENQKYFVFYLPQEYIDYVDYGSTITVTGKTTVKDEAAREYKATIQYIDMKAQYTPKEAESSANKNHLSFKVKAVLEPDCDLRVAQKANVTFGK